MPIASLCQLSASLFLQFQWGSWKENLLDIGLFWLWHCELFLFRLSIFANKTNATWVLLFGFDHSQKERKKEPGEISGTLRHATHPNIIEMNMMGRLTCFGQAAAIDQGLQSVLPKCTGYYWGFCSTIAHSIRPKFSTHIHIYDYIHIYLYETHTLSYTHTPTHPHTHSLSLSLLSLSLSLSLSFSLSLRHW